MSQLNESRPDRLRKKISKLEERRANKLSEIKDGDHQLNNDAKWIGVYGTRISEKDPETGTIAYTSKEDWKNGTPSNILKNYKYIQNNIAHREKLQNQVRKINNKHEKIKNKLDN